MRRTAISAAITVMVICGCGKSAQPVLIAAEGDSTTWGEQVVNGVSKRTSNTTPALLQAALRGTFGEAVTVENRGVRGATAAQILNGTATYIGAYAKPYAEAVKTDPAQIVIFNFAINDSAPSNHESPEAYGRALVELVSLTRAAGKIAVLEEPNPVSGNAALAAYVDEMDSIAKQLNVPIIRQFKQTLAIPDWKTMLTDGIHPNDDLYRIKASREANILSPIAGDLR